MIIKKYINIGIVVFAALLVLSACKQKDKWLNRTYHKTTARFNPYFNGEQAFLKGQQTLQNAHVDDYSEILSVYKFGDEKAAKSIEQDMERAIEKGGIVIREHSIVSRNKQKNIYTVKAYLLLGKARFYKYDFFPALETFNYVIQSFGKDPKAKEIVHEAKLWAGRCQVMIGNPAGAEVYFDDLYKNRKVHKRMKADVSASRAQMQINAEDYKTAITSLREANHFKPKKEMRVRWKFIEAQLQEKLGNNYEASQAYKDVILMKPADYELTFVAQLNRAKNFDVYLENVDIVYRELNKMLEDEKNEEYKDQIYFVMAEVALAEEEYDKADDYLKKSIRASVSNNTQKGLSYLKIADMNFTFKDYVLAQNYYDSAATALPGAHKQSEFAKNRAESLSGIVKNLNIIALEDSLQRMAQFSPEEQRKKYEAYIKWLIEEEERIAREKELEELNKQLVANSKNMAGNTVGGKGGWYFYNENTRASGITQFQSQWGTRKLEDNWRQKNKEVANFEDGEQTANTNQSPSNTAKKGGKYDPEYYLKQVPNTQEMMDSSNNRVMNALVALGDIYREEIKDAGEAIKSYDKELNRFPGSKVEPRVLFSAYRTYVGKKDTANAQPYKDKLINTYPSSVYAQLLLNEGKPEKTNENYQKVAVLYQKAFEYYKDEKYRTCMKYIGANRESISSSILAPKFELLVAMCYGRQQKEEELIATLKAIVETYPGTAEAAKAKSILDLTDEGGGDGEGENTTALNNFKYDANSGHKFVVIFPNQGVDLNALKNAIADFNQQKFKLERLQMQNIFFDKERQMVVVNGLKNAAKARVYFKSLSADQRIMGYLPTNLATRIIISDKNYVELYKEKNLEEYLGFLETNYQIKTQR